MKAKSWSLFAVLIAFSLSISALRAENAADPKPADGPPGPPPGPPPNGPDDNPQQRGQWRGKGLMQMLGNNGSAAGRGMLVEMASRMSGATLESPTDLAKFDNLPLGADRRFVLSVPIGGIDDFNNRGQAWRMEQVFTLTDEQQKAVNALRDEYHADQKKLEDDIAAQQKILADKVKQLRQTYEQRANDILTGPDKEAKQKLDALAKDTQAKNTASAADLSALIQDPNAKDPAQLMTVTRTVREATTKTIQDARKALLDTVPAESRNKADELLKQDEANQPPAPPGAWGDQQGWGKHHGGRGTAQDKPAEPEKAKGEF